MAKTDVEDIVKDFWGTRPRRRRDDRKLAGVAGALGRRYAVDPILLRVAFVVLTIYGGVGILLYLLGWLLLPGEGDEASAGESLLGRGRSSVPTVLAVVLAVALVPVFIGTMVGDPAGLVAVAAAGGGLYLLHRNRAALGELPGAAGAATMTAAPADASPSPPYPASNPQAPGASQPDRPGGDPAARASTDEPVPAPPAWDPLGAAPFAWDLPEPGTPPAPQPPARARSRVTPVTLGTALVVGGAAALLAPAVGWLGPAQVAGVALAVVGVGLVVGSLRRGGRGLIGVAIPLAALTYVLHAAPLDDWGGAGERRWSASTVAELAPAYRLSVGSAHLDLTRLAVADGSTARTEVTTSLGEVKVFLPPEVDVVLSCSAGTGNVHCLGREASGPAPSTSETDAGVDGPGGGTLVLDVRAGTGDVEVLRGR